MHRYLLAFVLPVVVFSAACERTVIRREFDGGIVCGTSEKLIDGECQFVCDRDSDCAVNEVCNLFTGKCVAAPPDSGRPVVTVPCTVGAERCRTDNKAVESCVDGGVWSTTEVCPGTGFCLNEACLACQPGLATCDASNNKLITVCQNDGSGTRQITCAGAGICSQGECRECAPNTTRCSTDGKTVQTCTKTNDETLIWKWENSGDNFDGTCITQVCETPTGGAARCKAPSCFPGTAQCKSTTTQQICSDQGAWVDQLCSAIPGNTSAAECQSGVCIDECVEAARSKAYFGCEYWSTTMDNGVDALFKGVNNSTQPTQGTQPSQFAFVVANRSSSAATVEIFRWLNNAESKFTTVTVPGKDDPTTKGLRTIYVPWQAIGPSDQPYVTVSHTGLRRYGYRLTSTRPIALYQFNPLDFRKTTNTTCSGSGAVLDCDDSPSFNFFDPQTWGECQSGKCNYYSYSNDASLLLPTHILGKSHVALTIDHSAVGGANGQQLNGHITIVGTQDNTVVTVKSSAITTANTTGTAITPMAKGESRNFTLNRYDVLQLASGFGGAQLECSGNGASQICRYDNDLTGTTVTSDKPVALFGGSSCSNKPYEKGACDHLEEQIFPFETWGKTFIGSQSKGYRLSNNTFASGNTQAPDHYKVVASCSPTSCPNGTTLTFSTPPQAAEVLLPNRCLAGTSLPANNCRLAGGTAIEFKTKTAFVLTADQPIAVAQFFTGQSASGGVTNPPVQGDPSITLLPPAEQWRANYTVLTAPGFRDNYLGLSVDLSKVAQVKVDGAVIATSAFTAVPNTPPGSYSVATVAVSAGQPHNIEIVPRSGQTQIPGAGVIVYGFDEYVSYGYTGGLDLQTIVSGINPGG